MLIRVGSGSSGIKEYLEKGQKQGRYFSRDELDERVILVGNLERTNAVIESLPEDKKSRYFHYTLSFKEHYIQPEILEDIALEFEQFIKTAYHDDELEFYAEAHLPKIRSYKDANDNEIERLAHIHVVIPKINLIDGNRYDPLIPLQVKYLDAFQECTNAKYGLASPKDNQRQKFNSSSEMISRYKGDYFNGHNKETKTQILEFILNNQPANQLELYQQLSAAGFVVKIRNGNKPEASYLNVIPHGETKGVNLKDSCFKNDFLSLPHADKIKFLGQSENIEYRDRGPETATKGNYQHNLEQWKEWRALEIRYVPSLSKSERTKYKNLSDEGKANFMHQRHSQTLTENLKLNGVIKNDGINNLNQRELSNIIRKIDRNSEHLEHDISRITTTTSGARERIRESAARSNSREYRANIELSKSTSTTPKQSSAEQLKEENNKETATKKHEYTIKELNNLIKADVLLELAEKTHGMNPELYFISVDSSGNDRIKCGNRNLNMVDFVTKELNLPFREALPYLANVYNMQQELNREKPLKRDKKYLLAEYKEWFVNYHHERTNLMQEARKSYSTTRQDILKKHNELVNEIRANKSLSRARKTFEINLAKAQKAINLDALQKSNNIQLADIRQKFNKDMQSAYRLFLSERAAKGDDEALEELRRLRIKFDADKNIIRSVERYQEYRLNISYDVDINGTINYKLNGKIILRDEGSRLAVVNTQPDNLKLSLDLAITKFGNKLTLDGNENFRKSLVETALKHNIKVEFLDDFSKNYYEQLKNELNKGAAVIRQNNDNLIKSPPARYQYQATRNVEIMDQLGKVKSVNLHTVKNMDTNEVTEITNAGLDYLKSKTQLHPGQLFDIKIAEDNIKFILTKEYKLRNEIKQEVLASRINQIQSEIKNTYNVAESLATTEGIFIKLATTKYGKEYALIKTDTGIIRFDKAAILEEIKTQALPPNSRIVLSVVTEETVTKTRELLKLKIAKADKFINYEELQLLADLQLQSPSKKLLIQEGLGEIRAIREFKTSDNSKLYRTELKTHTGEMRVFYLKNNHDINVGEYCYIRQLSGNKIDVVNLTEDKEKQLDSVKQKLESEGIENLEFSKLNKIGIRNIRGKDVFFAEYKLVEDGKSQVVTKYGEAIKDQIFENELKPGDLIAIAKTNEQESYNELEQIIVVRQLDFDLDNEVDARLAALQSLDKKQEIDEAIANLKNEREDENLAEDFETPESDHSNQIEFN